MSDKIFGNGDGKKYWRVEYILSVNGGRSAETRTVHFTTNVDTFSVTDVTKFINDSENKDNNGKRRSVMNITGINAVTKSAYLKVREANGDANE